MNVKIFDYACRIALVLVHGTDISCGKNLVGGLRYELNLCVCGELLTCIGYGVAMVCRHVSVCIAVASCRC